MASKANSTAFNLKNRGNLSIFISETLVKDGGLIVPAKTGRPSRPMKYTDELIEFVLTIRELFHMPLRQVTGFVEFLFKTMGISGAPDYTTVPKRMSVIKVRYQRKIEHRANNNAGIVMLVDSSGFKVVGFHASIIAPPKKNAIYHYDLKDGKLIDVPGHEERNRVIRAIQRAGGLEEWKNSVDYHRRSFVENAFYRWKTSLAIILNLEKMKLNIQNNA